MIAFVIASDTAVFTSSSSSSVGWSLVRNVAIQILPSASFSDMASILSFISFFIIFTPLYFIHDTDLILQTGDLQQFPDPWVRVDHDRPSAKAGNSGVSAR